MQTKRLITLFILFSISLGQISCQKGKDVPAKPLGGILTIGQITMPKTLNPVLEVSGVSSQLVDIIFDGLIRLGEQGEILPGLAVSWEMKNGGQQWIFHLRRGVKFHDGHPFTARDVEFTLNLVTDPRMKSGYAHYLRQIKKMTVRDSYTLVIQLVSPSTSFIYAFTLGILPRHLLEGEDILHTSFNYQPIGTGPFRLIRWSPDRVELGANQDYFLGRPYLDRVVVRLFNNQRLVWAYMMKGEIDAFQLLDPAAYEVIRKISRFRVYSALRPYYYIIGFNLTNPLFQDRRVRRALNYAINKECIIKKVLKGRGMAASGTIFPSSWAFDARCKPFPYDPHRALELLKEAGWQDTDGDHILDKSGQPFEFQLYLPEGHDELETSSLMIVDQLSNIGIIVRIRKFPMEIINQKYLLTREFDAAFLYIDSGSAPEKNNEFWHSSQIRDGFNFFSYHNPRIDQLLDQGRCTFAQEQRKIIYDRYQEEMKEDPPCLFLFWRQYLLGVNERFHGVHISPFGGLLNNIREWYKK